MQRTDIQTATRQYLGELGAQYVTSTAIVDAINRTARKLNKRTGFNVVDATTSIRTGARENTLATGIMDIYRVRLGTGADRTRLKPTSEGALDHTDANWEGATAGTPTKYYTDGMKLGFHPRPLVRTAWASSTNYAANAIIVPVTENGFTYKCTTTGTSGTTQPTWPTTLDGTIGEGVSRTPLWTQDGHTRVYMRCFRNPASLATATSVPSWLPEYYHDTLGKGAALDIASGYDAEGQGGPVRLTRLYEEYLEDEKALRALRKKRSREYTPVLRVVGYGVYKNRSDENDDD